MDDIISQIIKIDSIAFENKKKNEQFLINKKQEYEDILNNYKNEKVAIAKFKVDVINKNIKEELNQQEKLDNEKINELIANMEIEYSAIENELVNEIFEKLFVLEN